MSLFEFFVLGIYLSLLTSLIIAIQVFNLGKLTRELQVVEFQEDKLVKPELEEPDSEEDERAPFNPETEEYEMTENPMLRHRKIEQKEVSLMEQVD